MNLDAYGPQWFPVIMLLRGRPGQWRFGQDGIPGGDMGAGCAVTWSNMARDRGEAMLPSSAPRKIFSRALTRSTDVRPHKTQEILSGP